MPYSSAKNLCRQYNELRFIDVDLIFTQSATYRFTVNEATSFTDRARFRLVCQNTGKSTIEIDIKLHFFSFNK